MSTTLTRPQDGPAVPSTEVINQAMSLISTLGGSVGTKQLLVDLKEAAEFNQGLIETAKTLKLGHDRRENELGERKADLLEKEKLLAEAVAHNHKIKDELITAATNIGLRNDEMKVHKIDYGKAQKAFDSDLNNILQLLDKARRIDV